jgi:TonB family protein
MNHIFRMIVLMFTALSGAYAQDSSQSVKKQIEPSLISITASDKTGKTVNGVGVFVSEEGKVIAHLQLIEDASGVEMKGYGGKTYAFDKVLAKSNRTFTALFSSAPPTDGAKAARIGNGSPAVGERLIVAVLNERAELVFVEGAVKNIQQIASWWNVQVNAALPHGSLGGLVFNMNGEFIAVVPSQSNTEKYFFALGGDSLLAFIENREDKADDSFSKGAHQLGGLIRGQAVTRVAPTYPPIARDIRVFGTVVVQVVVDQQGNVTNARYLNGNFHGPRNIIEDQAKAVAEHLKKAAVDAARKWKFTPTLIGGTAVRVVGTISFNFNL